MPTFNYTARDSAGLAAAGSMVAGSVAEVGRMLRAEGKYPITVTPAGGGGGGGGGGGTGGRASAAGRGGIKIARTELIQLSNQLAIMVETGVTIVDALDTIVQQEVKPTRLKKLAADLLQHVEQGGDFSSALARHPRSFPRLYVALVKASERGGMLPKMLQRATTYLRDEHEIVRKVKGALTYPAIMFLFAITTTVFLLLFVLPKFTAIYASKAAALPMPTRVLMGISDTLLAQWMLILPGLVVTIGGTLAATRLTQPGRRALHWTQLHSPLLGKIFRELNLARGLRMLGTMAGAGVHLTDCVTTARELCDNVYFRDLWRDVESQIRDGKQLSEPLAKSALVPRSVARMIQSGEKGGKVAQVMEQLASYSESELKERISEMTRYIEPAMIVVMGGIIGGVSLALLLPIFSISKVMAS